MSFPYDKLKKELEVTRKEILSKLWKWNERQFHYEWGYDEAAEVKERIVLKEMKDELKDVERALFKMESGTYGICEKTGESIPIVSLKVIPTARTIDDIPLLIQKAQRVYD